MFWNFLPLRVVFTSRNRKKSAGTRSGKRGWLIANKLWFASKHFTVIAERRGALLCKKSQLPLSQIWSFILKICFNTFPVHLHRIHCSLLFLHPQSLCESHSVYQNERATFLHCRKQNILGLGDDFVLHSILWCFVSELYWKTQDLSPVIMQLRKCGLHSQACLKWLQVATLCSSCRETVE